jgi:hypothetical protein
MGVERFRMDHIRAAVVALLHLSVLLFVAGLAINLFTINAIVFWTFIATTAVFATSYIALSILPLMDADCPFQTPLTPVFAIIAASLLFTFKEALLICSHLIPRLRPNSRFTAQLRGWLYRASDHIQGSATNLVLLNFGSRAKVLQQLATKRPFTHRLSFAIRRTTEGLDEIHKSATLIEGLNLIFPVSEPRGRDWDGSQDRLFDGELLCTLFAREGLAQQVNAVLASCSSLEHGDASFSLRRAHDTLQLVDRFMISLFGHAIGHVEVASSWLQSENMTKWKLPLPNSSTASLLSRTFLFALRARLWRILLDDTDPIHPNASVPGVDAVFSLMSNAMVPAQSTATDADLIYTGAIISTRDTLHRLPDLADLCVQWHKVKASRIRNERWSVFINNAMSFVEDILGADSDKELLHEPFYGYWIDAICDTDTIIAFSGPPPGACATMPKWLEVLLLRAGLQAWLRPIPDFSENPVATKHSGLLARFPKLVEIMRLARRFYLQPPLKAGWEERLVPDGRVYFVDHNSHTTMWINPRLPLPPGWEEKRRANGQAYFLDHNARTATLLDPRLPEWNPLLAGVDDGQMRDSRINFFEGDADPQAQADPFLITLHYVPPPPGRWLPKYQLSVSEPVGPDTFNTPSDPPASVRVGEEAIGQASQAAEVNGGRASQDNTDHDTLKSATNTSIPFYSRTPSDTAHADGGRDQASEGAQDDDVELSETHTCPSSNTFSNLLARDVDESELQWFVVDPDGGEEGRYVLRDEHAFCVVEPSESSPARSDEANGNQRIGDDASASVQVPRVTVGTSTGDESVETVNRPASGMCVEDGIPTYN